jgi:predicted Rossmann-fold nucleotide-binding protein
MLAASKGAREAGGEVIGVTCSAFKAGSANKFLCREIVTTSLNERLDTLISLGSAYVVLPGGTGTLLELALVWELKNKGFLTGDKPIILLGEYWRPLVKLVATDDKDAAKFLLIAENAEKVIGLLKSRNQHC